MKSIQQKIDQLEGLIDTKDVSAWESGFLVNVVKAHREKRELTTKQVEILDRIHERHFA